MGLSAWPDAFRWCARCWNSRPTLMASTPKGVDIRRWDAEGRLVNFTIMVRPMRGLCRRQELAELMALARW